jgi:hypothetical protein
MNIHNIQLTITNIIKLIFLILIFVVVYDIDNTQVLQKYFTNDTYKNISIRFVFPPK